MSIADADRTPPFAIVRNRVLSLPRILEIERTRHALDVRRNDDPTHAGTHGWVAQSTALVTHVTLGYDLAGRTTSITPAAGSPSGATPAVLALDALGRVWTRTTGTGLSVSTDTCTYLGTSDAVTGIATTGATTTSTRSAPGPGRLVRRGSCPTFTAAWRPRSARSCQ